VLLQGLVTAGYVRIVSNHLPGDCPSMRRLLRGRMAPAFYGSVVLGLLVPGAFYFATILTGAQAPGAVAPACAVAGGFWHVAIIRAETRSEESGVEPPQGAVPSGAEGLSAGPG
jgi:hypothetical protein